MFLLEITRLKIFVYLNDSEDSTKKGPKSGGRVAIGVTVFDLCRVICVIFSTNYCLFATKYEVFDFWLLRIFFAKSWLLVSFLVVLNP